MVRRLLKRRVEVLFSSPTICSLTKHRVRNKRLILAYHGIIPDGALADGERSLFIAQRDFANQLDMLAEVADVAPLDRLDEEGDGRPRVAITVDDAYRGAVCNGVRELVKRGMPATIFVAPACLDGHVFWWDALASSSGHVDRAIREYALCELDGCDERVRSWARSQSLGKTRPISAHACAATRAELRAAVAFPGITVGSHSWSHSNLATLRSDDLDWEVAQSRAWLKSEFGEKAIDWFAYPYGLDSLAAQQAVAVASYKGALRIDGGWHTASRVSPFGRPRYNVAAGLSVAGLKARVLGALPS